MSIMSKKFISFGSRLKIHVCFEHQKTEKRSSKSKFLLHRNRDKTFDRLDLILLSVQKFCPLEAGQVQQKLDFLQQLEQSMLKYSSFRKLLFSPLEMRFTQITFYLNCLTRHSVSYQAIGQPNLLYRVYFKNHETLVCGKMLFPDFSTNCFILAHHFVFADPRPFSQSRTSVWQRLHPRQQ